MYRIIIWYSSQCKWLLYDLAASIWLLFYGTHYKWLLYDIVTIIYRFYNIAPNLQYMIVILYRGHYIWLIYDIAAIIQFMIVI